MPPQKEIFKWVQKKGIQFRDNRGKFKTYESTAWAIAKSIKKRGIPATDFYSRTFQLRIQEATYCCAGGIRIRCRGVPRVHDKRIK